MCAYRVTGTIDMSELIEKARVRLREIEQEAERLRVFLAVAGELEGGSQSDVSGNRSDRKASDDDADTASPSEIVAAARLLIEERGRPLGRGMLVKELQARGLKLSGVDPVKNLGTAIWRSNQFENYAGFGYWPKDKPRWMGQRQRELPVE